MSIELHLGDCAQIMKSMPSDCVDLTVTSPPYDNLRTYKGYVFDFETIARELYRITKPGGVVVWVVGDATINGSETGTSFKQALYFKEIGFNLHDTMIYQKSEFPPLSHNRYEQQFEYMFIFSKSFIKTFNGIRINTVYPGQFRSHTNSKSEVGSAMRDKGGARLATKDTKLKTNVWLMAGEHTDINHPAIFPEELAKNHILSWSNPGDTVLDPMMGSGTTGKMAVNYERNFIGIETSQEYLTIAERRIHDAQQQMRLGI
jgi:site-specific DNA-methyltransferase (adenine-specific)